MNFALGFARWKRSFEKWRRIVTIGATKFLANTDNSHD